MKTKGKKVEIKRKENKVKKEKVKDKTPFTKSEWFPLPIGIWDEAIKRNPKIKVGKKNHFTCLRILKSSSTEFDYKSGSH
ncbi:hypothetical protein CH368_08490 [Leptospira levettii]|nr:hypothetical protein CH368_08490 [Leptospira levettii]